MGRITLDLTIIKRDDEEHVSAERKWYARNGPQLTGSEGIYFPDTPEGRKMLEDWVLRQLATLGSSSG